MPISRCTNAGCAEVFQHFAVFFCAMNVMNAGVEYGWTSAALPILLAVKENVTTPVVTSEQGVWIATLPLPGAIIGALANAFICDHIGRKPIIILSNLPYMIHWILIAVASSSYFYYIARFLAGISTGFCLSVIPMYVGEISSITNRGRMSIVIPMCVTAAIVLINILNLFLTIEASALVCLVFPVTSFFGLLFMPESPYFYLMKKKDAKAMRSLQIFQGKADIDSDFKRIKEAVEEHQNDKKKEGLKALVSIPVNRHGLCIVLILRSAQPLSGITTIVYYSSVILGQAESSLSVKYSTLIFAICLMLTVLIGRFIVDSLGRRPLILFSLVGSFIGLVLLGVFFHLKAYNIDLSSYSFMPLISMVIIVSFYGVGLQPIPYVLQGELFSTGIKAPAVALGLVVFCLFSLLCSKYFQYMNDNMLGHYSIYTYAVCGVATFFYILFQMPETKGISMEEVQLMLKQRKLHFKDVDISSQ